MKKQRADVLRADKKQRVDFFNGFLHEYETEGGRFLSKHEGEMGHGSHCLAGKRGWHSPILFGSSLHSSISSSPATSNTATRCGFDRGASLIRNRTPLRTAIGPYAYAYCRVLGGGIFLRARYPCMVHNAASYPKHQPESLLARVPDPPLLSSPASPRIDFQSTNPKSMSLRGVQL